LAGEQKIAPIAAGSGGRGRGYAAFVDRLIASILGSRARSAAAIALVALLCLLPGFAAMPPVDRDEPTFASASRQMLAAGDLTSIPTPPGASAARGPAIYWLQAGVLQLFGRGAEASIPVYRIPSLVAGMAAALLTWWAALAFGRARAALFAGLAMAACLMVAGEMRVGRPDAILLPALILTQGALARLWLAKDGIKRDWIHIALFWTALAATMAADGLLGLLVVVPTVALLCAADRSLSWLRRLAPLAGIVWLLMLVLPWLLTIQAVGTGRPFLVGFFGWDAIASFFARPDNFNPPPGF
jgi:4-amino-4-deoxy-L-arabinose transferase-like glycosyltransferase